MKNACCLRLAPSKFSPTASVRASGRFVPRCEIKDINNTITVVLLKVFSKNIQRNRQLHTLASYDITFISVNIRQQSLGIWSLHA